MSASDASSTFSRSIVAFPEFNWYNVNCYNMSSDAAQFYTKLAERVGLHAVKNHHDAAANLSVWVCFASALPYARAGHSMPRG